MFLDICKRHGLELDEEPSYGGRKYLEKQDYIRMKQKEEIADQQETILMQIDKVNENRLELAKQMECEKKQIVVGYRDAHTFLKEEFEQLAMRGHETITGITNRRK